MAKSCFVIMGFGIKNNINLDLTYNKIIKPCIKEKDLIPFPLYAEARYNAYRCDEITGGTSIDYKFVTCLNGADIVIADISTMNANAIYELGARHALKPRSTILLCAKDKAQEFKFFDITYVPIIFYEHKGTRISDKAISDTKRLLNEFLDFSIHSKSKLPDNPIQRALIESQSYQRIPIPQTNIYELYTKGKHELDICDYENADNTLSELYRQDPSEENLLLLVLARYKKAELARSFKGLVDCITLIKSNVNIDVATSETLFGSLGAICLRIYALSGDNDYYYDALDYYRRGATYGQNNLYCARNYCALLCRIYEITEDKNTITEYFYTAKHYAKLYLNMGSSAAKKENYDDIIYHFYNVNDLRSIAEGEYRDYEKVYQRLENDCDVSKRQKKTVLEGITKLKDDIEKMTHIVKFSFD